MNLIEEMKSYLKIVNEAKITDDPNVSYEYKGRTKAATARGEYDSVVATLTGAKSAVFTRMAKQFKILDMVAKRAKERRDRLNEDARNAVKELFDAEDAALTRYVDTVSLAITLAKDTKEETTEERKFDAEGFMEELYRTVGEDLIPVLKALEERYTIIEQKTRKGSEGAIKAIKLKEESEEGLMQKLANFAGDFKDVVMQRLDKFDNKVEQLKTEYGYE